MGYESMLYVCKRKSSRGKAITQLGEIDLGKICYPYWDLPYHKMLCDIFKEPLGCALVVDGESVTEDKYGDPLRTASADAVIRYLKSFVKRNEDHRYARWALEEIEEKQAKCKYADKVFFVHYGY